jgi:hypothetical protein
MHRSLKMWARDHVLGLPLITTLHPGTVEYYFRRMDLYMVSACHVRSAGVRIQTDESWLETWNRKVIFFHAADGDIAIKWLFLPPKCNPEHAVRRHWLPARLTHFRSVLRWARHGWRDGKFKAEYGYGYRICIFLEKYQYKNIDITFQ